MVLENASYQEVISLSLNQCQSKVCLMHRQPGLSTTIVGLKEQN